MEMGSSGMKSRDSYRSAFSSKNPFKSGERSKRLGPLLFDFLAMPRKIRAKFAANGICASRNTVGVKCTGHPIIIHLLHFRRFRRVAFSQVAFLNAVQKDTKATQRSGTGGYSSCTLACLCRDHHGFRPTTIATHKHFCWITSHSQRMVMPFPSTSTTAIRWRPKEKKDNCFR